MNKNLTMDMLQSWRDELAKPSAVQDQINALVHSAMATQDRLLRRVIDTYWAQAGHPPSKVWMCAGDPFLGVAWECGVGDLPPGKAGTVYVLGDNFPQVYAQVRIREMDELAGSTSGRFVDSLKEQP